MNILKENKSEKILISTALIMFAVIIGYNAFFVPEMPNLIESSGNLVAKKISKEKNKNTKSSGLVNINTSSQDELVENLTGIGPVMAKRIISYRKTHGGFSSVEELKNIKGIGEKVFEKLKDSISTE